MDLTLTDDQEMIRDTARELLAARAATADARAVGADGQGPGWSRALWAEMVELGWTGLALPEKYGGVGADAGFLELCLLIEEMGRFQIPSPFLPSVVCCGTAVERFGTEEQRARWLTAIAEGRVLTYARAAPQGRWSAAAGSDVVATERGDGFDLHGTAESVPYAADADALLVFARREPGGGLTAFVVDAEGLGCTPVEVVGMDRRYRVRFDHVAVPPDRLLGDIGDGARAAESLAQFGAAATCAEMVGGAQRVLEMTVEYARQREQFGRPIGAFQAVQHHCADMAMDVLGARFIAYEAIWRLAEGHEAQVEVATAKAWVSEAYERVCARGHQVHGAIGFTAEHDLPGYSRHAMGAALDFGDGDHHFDRLAGLIGLPER